MSALGALRRRAAGSSPRFWLTLIVLASVAVRIALARRIVAPWIMVDEIVYSELAKSFAAHGQFLVRGVPSHGYGVVYPILIAPAWRLFGSIPNVYVAAKAINSVLMSLAAIPAYFLARRLLDRRLSLLAALLSVLLPEMLYTGMIMTENVFYPVFLCFALALVCMLERPTARRQLGLLVLFALLFETRAQAVALLPAAATAPLVLAAIRREQGLVASLRRFAVLYGILAAAALAVLVGTVARGRSPFTLLGAYNAATTSTYTVGGVARYLLYHVAGLDLYLGILPFAALLALWFSPRLGGTARAAFVAASFSVSLWLIPEVAAFASQPSVLRIEERNMFYLAPFALIALLGLASDDLLPRRGPAVLAAALLAALLPFFIPFATFISTSAVSDTFSMLPWWWVQDHWITLGQVKYAALGVGVAAAVLFVALPRRYALVLSALVAAYFVATSAVVDNGRHGIHVTSVGSLWAGSHLPHPDWIDRSVGADASVIVLWTGLTTPYPVWEDEFFNRSVRAVYDYGGSPPDPLPQQPVVRSRDGRLLLDGHVLEAQYVLTDGSVELAGKLVKRDPVGVLLYRIDGPVVVLSRVSGLYPNDTWSGPTVTYQRVECSGGALAVTFQSDPKLFTRPQVVVASEAGRRVGRISVAPDAEPTLNVPLAARGGTCSVRFQVAYTRVPARVQPGSSDERQLGVHFVSFSYRP